jgi:hypothetical protein
MYINHGTDSNYKLLQWCMVAIQCSVHHCKPFQVVWFKHILATEKVETGLDEESGVDVLSFK